MGSVLNSPYSRPPLPAKHVPLAEHRPEQQSASTPQLAPRGVQVFSGACWQKLSRQLSPQQSAFVVQALPSERQLVSSPGSPVVASTMHTSAEMVQVFPVGSQLAESSPK